MPRDSNGNYSLPPGNPVIPQTIIETDWANPTMEDIAAALTQSLSRTGQGGMLVPFKNADGTINGPGMTWTNEPRSGWYRKASGQFWYSVDGVDILGITSQGVFLAAGKIASGFPYLPLSGGTLTGELFLAPGQPTLAESAVSKAYVDNIVSGIVIKNYTSDATGDAQSTVEDAWNAQANALGITRATNEVTFYRWPSNGNNAYRYEGNQLNPPYTTVATDWLVSSAIVDAPIDGDTYGRKDAVWVPVLNRTGGTMTGPITLALGMTGAQAQSVDGAQAQVDAKMTQHVADVDPHTQYLTQAEGDLFYIKVGTPVGVTDHGQLTGLSDDDHQQYFNQARGDVRYDPLGAGTAAVADHVAQADPHTQYLTSADGNALYDPLGAATQAVSDHVAAADPHTQYLTEPEADAIYEQLVNKGATNGYCPLGPSTVVQPQYLPYSSLNFQGGWDASGGTLPVPTASGDLWIITAAGTINVVPPNSPSGLPEPTFADVGNFIVYSGVTTYFYLVAPTFAALDTRYVQLTGGTMTGPLSVPLGGSGAQVIQSDEVNARDTAAIAAHVALADPHSQYLTSTEGGTLYDALGAATTAVADHVAQADPHTQYLTSAEGSAIYAPIGDGQAAVDAHVAVANPHTQYLQQSTADARYLQLIGGSLSGPLSVPAGAAGGQVPQRQEVDSAINTSMSNHLAAVDPHAQYTTQAEAAAEASAAVATHVAQPDPHPQYLLRSEGGGNADTLPVGTIIDSASPNIPQNYLMCDGGIYANTAYPDLFQAIGYTWGGDGVSTFAVPNLNGAVAIGSGVNYPGIIGPNLTNSGGASTHTLTEAEIPAHVHALALETVVGYANGTGNGPIQSGLQNTNSTGGNQPHNNMQPSVVVYKCIKAVSGTGAAPPGGYLPLAGGTMTGPVYLPAAPASGQQAVSYNQAKTLGVAEVGQCRLVYENPSSVRLNPFNGNSIKISGVQYQIPAGGLGYNLFNGTAYVNGVLGSLAPNTFYYVYAFLISSAVALNFSAQPYTADATLGNEGVRVMLGNNANTLVGALYVGAVNDLKSWLVRSWFNDPGTTRTTEIAVAVATASTQPLEIDTSIRNSILLWAGETLDITYYGTVQSDTLNAISYSYISLDGGSINTAIQTFQAAGGGYGIAFFHTYSGSTTPEGYHEVGMLAQVSQGTSIWYGANYGASLCRMKVCCTGRK